MNQPGSSTSSVSRDEILLDYIDRLPFPPYPVQEQAMYAWAACDGGVLLSAPTGTGKTLVAETAVYEALRTQREIYYSTPLIALTDQKFLELQATVTRWGYPPEEVGLVTGQKSINPRALVKVVVAEVLLNRLLHPEAHDFSRVGAVVMDEFHNFNEPERGIVWELALMLLPPHVRVMLLSATVGAAQEFVSWLARASGRILTLVSGTERKVPLRFEWVGDELLPDFIEKVCLADGDRRRAPLLLFCFDRSICWDTAEVLRGKSLLGEAQRDQLMKRLDEFDFSVGVGAKLRTFLARGVGIHHAGVLPRYRRLVETLFQEKLLPVCICTETLAAGINLPARSVVLSTLVKGPKTKKKLIEASSVQQIFGRAGRPQFDSEGHVYVLAHEDDVKLARWQEKYDTIPEDTKDPKLLVAKKGLLKKKPTRRQGFTYWNPEQFLKLQTAPPSKLQSRGRLTWRWLGFLLEADDNVESIRAVVRRRLMDAPTIEAEQKRLTRMLVTLHQQGIVLLDPPPPPEWQKAVDPSAVADPLQPNGQPAGQPTDPPTDPPDDDDETPEPLLARLKLGSSSAIQAPGKSKQPLSPLAAYEPLRARPTARLKQLMTFRAVHPMYGLFLLKHLPQCDEAELIQLLEGLLEIPGSVARLLRVPKPDRMPPGPLTTNFVDPAILTRGLAAHDDLYPPEDQGDIPPELRKYPIPLAEKMKMLFESEIDHAGGLFITPVWAVGDLLSRGGSFDAYVRSRDLTRQEGVLFKHFLRMILLCREFIELATSHDSHQLDTTPSHQPINEQVPEQVPDPIIAPVQQPAVAAAIADALTPEASADLQQRIDPWPITLARIAETLTAVCHDVDPQSTDEILEEAE